MGARRARSGRTTERSARIHTATAVTIVAVEADERVVVRVPHDGLEPGGEGAARPGGTRAATARVAMIAGYRPTAGDRVLCAGEGDDLYVIGVLRAAQPPSLREPMALPDGGSIAVADGGVELRDPAGRLLVRYAGGTAEIAAPAGDLVLSSAGRVVVRSGLDVSLEAARDVVHHAGRSLELSARPDHAPQLHLDGRRVAVAADEVSSDAGTHRVTAREVRTDAGLVATKAETFAVTTGRYELSASRLVEKVHDAFRDVTDLAQSRIGRVRTIVKDVYTQRARRTVITSTDDTSVDGRKILLG